ncbi:MAG: transglutaminase-like domain-containing protein [Christensenellales bacterium]|jgi:transglutaminase-like putative cysteine protease
MSKQRTRARRRGCALRGWSLVACCLLLQGCAAPQAAPAAPQTVQTATPAAAARENTPVVREPVWGGVDVLSGDRAQIDASNTEQGYIQVRYDGDNPKVKLQIGFQDQTPCTYSLRAGVTDTFPLTQGDGVYHFAIYENLQDTSYVQVLGGEREVTLADAFAPFLYPNQYVAFTAASQTVAQGSQLAQGTTSDLDVVGRVYDYVVSSIAYDYEKAESVTSGYLPDVDETLATGKGICFDYAAVMTAMLRSQRIPTRLVVGYVGEIYHAWISVYIQGTGWVDNIIYFDGINWVMMDPTFAATGDAGKDYVGDGSGYHQVYIY